MPGHGGHHVRGAVLLRVAGRRGEQDGPGSPPAVLAVDDERVHGDLRVAEHEGQRVQAEDGEADGHLPGRSPSRRRGPRPDGEDDAVARVLEETAEAGRRRVQPGVPGEDVLGMRIGPVLPDERQHGGQVVGTRGARDDAGP